MLSSRTTAGYGGKTFSGEEWRRIRHALDSLYTNVVEDRGDTHNELVHELLEHIKTNGSMHIKEIAYTGSAYERTYVGSGHDYDVICYVDIDNQTISPFEEECPRLNDPRLQKKPSYTTIAASRSRVNQQGKRRRRGPRGDWWSKAGRLFACKIRRDFQAMVDGIFLGQTWQGWSVNRQINGPAVTLKLQKSATTVSVDLNVGVKIKGEVYVAKPMIQNSLNELSDGIFWFKDQAVEKEKEFFIGLDRGNQVHKKVLRLAKGLKKNNSQLGGVPSYAYKNVMLYLVDRGSHAVWTDHQLAQRFVEYFETLKRMLEDNNIPQYFGGIETILRPGRFEHADQVATYLTRVLASADSIVAFIQSAY